MSYQIINEEGNEVIHLEEKYTIFTDGPPSQQLSLYKEWLAEGNVPVPRATMSNDDILQGIRDDRNLKLAESDWTQSGDVLTPSKRAEWATYRQQLRDLPENISNPLEWREADNWPSEPD